MSDDGPKLPKFRKTEGMVNLKGRPKKNGAAKSNGNGAPLKPKLTFIPPGDATAANEGQVEATPPPAPMVQEKLVPVDPDSPLPTCDRQTFRTVKYINAGIIEKNLKGEETITFATNEFSPMSTFEDFHRWFENQFIELHFMNEKRELVDRREIDFRGQPPPKRREDDLPGTSGQPPPPPPRIVKPQRGSGRKNGVDIEKFNPDESAIPDDLEPYQRQQWVMHAQVRREYAAEHEHLKRLIVQTSLEQNAALARSAEKILSDTGINDRVAQGLRSDLEHMRLEKAQTALSHTRQMDEMFRMVADMRKTSTEDLEKVRSERDRLKAENRELKALLEGHGQGSDFITEVLKGFGKEKASKVLEAFATRTGLLGAGAAAGAVAAAPGSNGTTAAIGAGAVAAGAAASPSTGSL